MNEKDEITRVCWNGCSFTVGDGFPIHQRDQYIYDRLVSKQFGFESTNISVSGSSNLEIFKRSAQAILNKEHDIVITQWSALNRLRLHPGPDCSFVLNDDFTGGEFSFFNQQVKYKIPKGGALLFPSTFLYPHAVLPVTEGTRYAVITWFH